VFRFTWNELSSAGGDG